MFLNWCFNKVRGRRGNSRARGRGPRAETRPHFRPRVEELEPITLLTGGTWTALTHLAPDPKGVMAMELLSDGTVMVHGGDAVTNDASWYRLTPDSFGNYFDGTWSTLASQNLGRLYFTADTLQDGRIFVYGGEYSGSAGSNIGSANFVNSGDIYNPLTNTWKPVATIPNSLDSQNEFGDDPSEVLANGTILAGYLAAEQTFIYNPATDAWSAGATKLNTDRSDEESWVKLPGLASDILTYNVFSTKTSQRYEQGPKKWVDSGAVPVTLETSKSELGPGLLLPNGKALFIGGTSVTALYTPSLTAGGTGSWVAGPTIPGGQGADDAPGAVEPNGTVLFAVGETPNFGTTTTLLEYNFATNAITNVTLPAALSNALANIPQFVTNMLVLPNGQILFTDSTDQAWVYTPNGGPQNAWRPTILSITSNGGNLFTLKGTQLNGLSEGSGYGDDSESATNYPIVRITTAQGKVMYARTFNWSSTGVATGSAIVSTQFIMPAGISLNSVTLVVIANGIPSLPYNPNGVGGAASQVHLLYPFRYDYNPFLQTYTGMLTLTNTGDEAISGTFTILFNRLPPGSVLLNAQGYLNGVPFVRVQATLPPNGSIIVPIVLTDPLGIYLSTFFQGSMCTVLIS